MGPALPCLTCCLTRHGRGQGPDPKPPAASDIAELSLFPSRAVEGVARMAVDPGERKPAMLAASWAGSMALAGLKEDRKPQHENRAGGTSPGPYTHRSAGQPGTSCGAEGRGAPVPQMLRELLAPLLRFNPTARVLPGAAQPEIRLVCQQLCCLASPLPRTASSCLLRAVPSPWRQHCRPSSALAAEPLPDLCAFFSPPGTPALFNWHPAPPHRLHRGRLQEGQPQQPGGWNGEAVPLGDLRGPNMLAPPHPTGG